MRKGIDMEKPSGSHLYTVLQEQSVQFFFRSFFISDLQPYQITSGRLGVTNTVKVNMGTQGIQGGLHPFTVNPVDPF